MSLKLIIAVCLSTTQSVFASSLVTAGPFIQIFDTTSHSSSLPAWYINDHTLIPGPGGVWHLFGITHTEPADPIFEVNFAHAISAPNASLARLNGFASLPFALGSIRPETHLWAPHLIALPSTGSPTTYKMAYCGGADDRTKYELNLVTSSDLYEWKREGVMFTAGIDGRDPMLLNLGPAFNNSWVIYYTGTNPNSLDNCAKTQHVTFVRRALDSSFLKWGEEQIVFVGGIDGECYGGPTESPFVVRRGDKNFYLFSGSWGSNYSDTRVFLSNDPFNFGSVPSGTAQQVGEIPAHAPEVMRDWDGTYYVSRAGWEQGGVFVSPLTWHDQLDSLPSSLPVPSYLPPLPLDFNTNLKGWTSVGGQWATTPSGLYGANALGDAFLMFDTQPTTSSYVIEADIVLLTKDGNPTTQQSQWTRQGSAAALVFGCQNRHDPLAGSYVVNLMATGGSTMGGLKIFMFPYRELFAVSLPIAQATSYHLRIAVSTKPDAPSTSITAYLDGKLVAQATDSSFTAGSLGVNVWQSSSSFQNLFLSQ